MPRLQYSEKIQRSTVVRPILIHEAADGSTDAFPLDVGDSVVLGRDAASGIRIDSPYASSKHAVIQQRGGEWAVEDLDSANGTTVNGRAIRVHYALRPGDRIQIGDRLFRFADAAAPTRDAAVVRGPARWVRLAVAGGASATILVVLLALLVPGANRESPGGMQAGGSTTAVSRAGNPVRVVDAALIQQTAARAKQTGVSEAEALTDEGLMHLESGRYREATQLLAAALQRKPTDEKIKGRLSDAQHALEHAIADATADATAADGQLRYADAMLGWDRLIAMTYPGDPRYEHAVRQLRRLEQERGRHSEVGR